MALPVAFDPQGFPIVNAIVQGGGGGITVDVGADPQSQPAPNPAAINDPTAVSLMAEPDHALRTRARVLTDEGSFQGYFPGASLYRALTGTCTIAAGGTAVTGVGTLFTQECRVGDYWEITAHHSNTVPVLAQIQSIESDTALTLRTAYTGGAAAGAAAQVCDWYVFCTANAGDGIAVAGGVAQLTLGVVNGSRALLARRLGAGGRKGCAPLHARLHIVQTVRRANQVCSFGLVSALGTLATRTQIAAFDWPGGGAAGDIELITGRDIAAGLGTTVTEKIPDGGDITAPLTYDVFLHEDHVEFFCGLQRLRTVYGDYSSVRLPDPYQEMWLYAQFENIGVPGGATTVGVYSGIIKSLDTVDARVAQHNPDDLHATVYDKSIFTTGAPRAPTNIADDLVHEVTDPAGAGMDAGHTYVVVQVGGDALQAYISDAGAPAVATARRSPYRLLNNVEREFRCKRSGERIYVVKAVNGTANADVYVDSCDGGNGA